VYRRGTAAEKSIKTHPAPTIIERMTRPGQTQPPGAIPADIAETQQAVIVCRPNGVIVHVNQAFTRLTGLTADAAAGVDPETLGLSTGERVRWLVDRLPAAGQGYRYTCVFDTPAGLRTHEVDMHTADVAGEVLVFATLRDVEPDATSDIGVLGAVVDAAPLGVVVYDRGLRIVRVNPAVEAAGRIGPMHIGLHLTEAVPAIPADFVHAVERVFRSGESVVNRQVETAAGQSYLLTLFPIRDDAGEVVLAGCLYSDVTGRVAAERALVASERHRRRILVAMLQAEEDERSRIATELHDDTVQVMTASLLALDRLALVARRTGEAPLEEAVAQARATLEEATDRTRRLMFELRPAILHEHGLAAAIHVLVDQVAREVGATAGVAGQVGRHDRALEELLYRSVQEALANVRKHARASRIEVALEERRGRLLCTVSDDGRGFDVPAARSRPQAAFHLGIDSLVERLRAAGGDVSIESAPGSGTRVRFVLPVSSQRRAAA
jgi:PAS domain S-box-containing protein